MAYRKSSKNQQFTVVFNEVAQHETLSMEARGLLLFMLSLPDDWAFHKNWLQKKCPGWGREKLGKILKELGEKGYLYRTPKRSEDGKKLAGWDWEVLAESALNPDSRQTRHPDKEVRQNSTEPDLRVCRLTANLSDDPVATTKETPIQNKQKAQNKKTTTTTSERERKISTPAADPKSGPVVNRDDHDQTTSEPPPKIALPVFIDRVVEGMSTSSVPGWFVAEMAAELWEQYSHPKTAMAMKIIYTDWTNTA